MKYYETKNIKNIVLVGGAKAGKSTLAECMMFEGGVISRMGTIENGNTVSDFHEYEQERQNSIFSTIMHTEWRGTKINIIDTPGLSDYIGQATPGFRVADTAVLLLGAQHGVDVGAEVMMRYLRKRNKPTIMAVNQIDHPKADFDKTIEEIKSQFSENVVLMQYPYNSGEGFDSIIDLLKMIMYKFSPTGGKPEKLPIPAEEKEKADELHNILVE
ncbi:GTP-binding protein, partial [bacterium]|nr:GTP-binding protein [bacterium]